MGLGEEHLANLSAHVTYPHFLVQHLLHLLRFCCTHVIFLTDQSLNPFLTVGDCHGINQIQFPLAEENT